MNNITNIIEFKVPKDWANVLGFGKVRISDDINGNYFEFDFFKIPQRFIKGIFKQDHINILAYKVLLFIKNININYLSDYFNQDLTKEQMIEHFDLILASFPSKIEIENFDDEYKFNINNENMLTIYNPFGDECVSHKSFKKLFKSVRRKLEEIIKFLDPQLELDEEYFKKIDNNHFSYQGHIKDLIYHIYEADIKKIYFNHLSDTDFYKYLGTIFKNQSGKNIPHSTVKKYYQLMKSGDIIEPSICNSEILVNDLLKIFNDRKVISQNKNLL